MKTKTIKLFAAASVFALGVAAVAGLASAGGVQNIFSTKADSTRTLTITAQQIGNAIGEGTSGNFVVDDLEWHVDGASYENGVANINGGTLYNVTFAGQSVSAKTGMKGNGFTRMIIHDKASASGINFETKDEKDELITRRGLGAETQASYVVDFTSDNTAMHQVYRVFMAFGAGGGTSFTSIDFEYTCATPTPAVVLSAPKTSESVGQTIQFTWNFAYVTGTPELTFASSNPSVASVSEHGGLVTGLTSGKTTISASFVYNTVTYYSNEIEVEFVSSIVYKDLTFKNTSNLEGAGVVLYIHNKDGESKILNADETSKVAVKVLFDGGTDFKGYEASNNNIDRVPDWVHTDDANEEASFHFTVPNGFPNDGDFVHTFKVTINYSASLVYEGQISITGNKTVTSTSGHWSN